MTQQTFTTCSACRRHEATVRQLQDQVADLEAELDRMALILTWGNDWVSLCADQEAAASSPGAPT